MRRVGKRDDLPHRPASVSTANRFAPASTSTSLRATRQVAHGCFHLDRIDLVPDKHATGSSGCVKTPSDARCSSDSAPVAVSVTLDIEPRSRKRPRCRDCVTSEATGGNCAATTRGTERAAGNVPAVPGRSPASSMAGGLDDLPRDHAPREAIPDLDDPATSPSMSIASPTSTGQQRRQRQLHRLALRRTFAEHTVSRASPRPMHTEHRRRGRPPGVPHPPRSR